MPYFQKYPYPKNFRFVKEVTFQKPKLSFDLTASSLGSQDKNLFAGQNYQIQVNFLEQEILKLTANQTQNPFLNYSIFKPELEKVKAEKWINQETNQVNFYTEHYHFVFDTETFGLNIFNQNQQSILKSDTEFLGFDGEKTIFQFKKRLDQPCWGLGGKSGNLNLSKRFFKLWNSDVATEQHFHAELGTFDPGYISIPFLILKTDFGFVGLFLDNPTETFFNTGQDNNFNQQERKKFKPNLYFGSTAGESSLYILPSKTLAEVSRKFANLTGKAEVPELWTLGKHQSKWSYKNQEEVKYIVENYQKNQIPLDVIWLDIDYMQDFQSFTWNQENYDSKQNLKSWLNQRNIKLVTMIDPGLKQKPGYFAYDEAVNQNLLCKTSSQKNFVGLVWPGESVFPDFSLEKTRAWWSEKIADFVKSEIDGIWIDMNDPSTAAVDPEAMKFDNGKVKHKYFHNQYANLMAKATYDGLKKAKPNQNPFILTRSASTGIQKYAAVWTGDNFSNWKHLQLSITQALNLSLSGIPFNGADVGGFLHETNPELITRWYQANFLFPFLRNHNMNFAFSYGCEEKHQEPFRFDESNMATIRFYINLRYKLLPYLYNLFVEHSKYGDPILRPIFYHFDDDRFYNINDEFMIGKDILQAPILNPEFNRKVLLPKGNWFDLMEKNWVKGGTEIEVHVPLITTKIYIRENAKIKQFKTDKFSNTSNLDWNKVEEVKYSFFV